MTIFIGSVHHLSVTEFIDAGFVPLLIQLLEDDEDPEIRIKASYTLFMISESVSHGSKLIIEAGGLINVLRILEDRFDPVV